jgi:hypothetical protein
LKLKPYVFVNFFMGWILLGMAYFFLTTDILTGSQKALCFIFNAFSGGLNMGVALSVIFPWRVPEDEQKE